MHLKNLLYFSLLSGVFLLTHVRGVVAGCPTDQGCSSDTDCKSNDCFNCCCENPRHGRKVCTDCSMCGSGSLKK